MRPRLRGFTKIFGFLTIALSAIVTVFIFQNCGTSESGFNPLYSDNPPNGCIGLSCDRSLGQASFKSTVTGIILDNGASSTGVCDSTNCFDIGGYCETGGFPKSVFIYQWFPPGSSTGLAEVRTNSICDDNGRFHVLVRVYPGFNSAVTGARLRLFMKVIDENNVEQLNPGEGEMSYAVTVRQ